MTRGFYKTRKADKVILSQIAFLEITIKARYNVLVEKEKANPEWAVERSRVGGFLTRIKTFHTNYQYWFT